MSAQFSNTPKSPGLIPDLSPLEHLLDQDVTPRQVCGVLAKMFQVQQTEVALLRLDQGLLQFIYPEELALAHIGDSQGLGGHSGKAKLNNA